MFLKSGVRKPICLGRPGNQAHESVANDPKQEIGSRDREHRALEFRFEKMSDRYLRVFIKKDYAAPREPSMLRSLSWMEGRCRPSLPSMTSWRFIESKSQRWNSATPITPKLPEH
jgi:hypothetical protein